MLPRHARCVLSRLRCNGHSRLVSSYFSRIGRIENSSCSACENLPQDTCYFIRHCPATNSMRRSLFGDSLSLYASGPVIGQLPGFWGSMVFRHAPIPRKGSGNNNKLWSILIKDLSLEKILRADIFRFLLNNTFQIRPGVTNCSNVPDSTLIMLASRKKMS